MDELVKNFRQSFLMIVKRLATKHKRELATLKKLKEEALLEEHGVTHV